MSSGCIVTTARASFESWWVLAYRWPRTSPVGTRSIARSSNDWQRFRAGAEPAPRPWVRHIHGWLDPDGHADGTFVLTESHYIALQSAAGASPNRDLAELLEGEGAVLIVGMSLADPNLRRLLYRARSPRS